MSKHSKLALSPAAAQGIAKEESWNRICMMLCNILALYLVLIVMCAPLSEWSWRVRCRDFTFVCTLSTLLFRIRHSFPVTSIADLFRMSVDYRLHIAHRISATVFEWVVCNVHGADSCRGCCFISPSAHPSPAVPANVWKVVCTLLW